MACTSWVKHKEIRVYECVYEYGQKSGANALPTYSYTYSYTPIPPFPDTQVLHLGSVWSVTGQRPAGLRSRIGHVPKRASQESMTFLIQP